MEVGVFVSNGLLQLRDPGSESSDFQRSVAIRGGTSINLVLKFQVNRACFHGEEADDRKWRKVEKEEKEKERIKRRAW